MPIPQAAQFRGGSHDGERHESDPASPWPDTLFCITCKDRQAYARTREEFVDENSVLRVVFQHDPDGSLAEQARRDFCAHPTVS